MTIGIYKLDFGISFYIGRSINIERRYMHHLYLLKSNTHCNIKLQLCYNNVGIPKLEIIEICDTELIEETEKYYINKFNAVTDGLNILTDSGFGGFGESNSRCNYTNNDLLEVFSYLVETDLSFDQISKLTQVSKSVIMSMSSCTNHTWIQAEFPEEYLILLNKKGNRTNSAAKLGIKYPKIQSPTGEVYEVTNLQEFSRLHKLDNSSLHQVLTGKRKTVSKWKVATGAEIYI